MFTNILFDLGYRYFIALFCTKVFKRLVVTSVEDPDVFGPPGSGSITRIQILPFALKCDERTEIMLAK